MDNKMSNHIEEIMNEIEKEKFDKEYDSLLNGIDEMDSGIGIDKPQIPDEILDRQYNISQMDNEIELELKQL